MYKCLLYIIGRIVKLVSRKNKSRITSVTKDLEIMFTRINFVNVLVEYLMLNVRFSSFIYIDCVTSEANNLKPNPDQVDEVQTNANEQCSHFSESNITNAYRSKWSIRACLRLFASSGSNLQRIRCALTQNANKINAFIRITRYVRRAYARTSNLVRNVRVTWIG